MQTTKINHLEQPLFFGEPVNIARYDTVKYGWIDKLTEKQHGFFWRPQEVDITKDQKDFKILSAAEKRIFTLNLKRQIVLDSEQGRSPTMAFLPICSLPELENWVQAWTFFETIHSRSYTHIIRNVYSNPSKVFDEILDDTEIVSLADDISKYYDNLINSTNLPLFERKKALWLCMNAVNALEGIRFYVSFACSWAFAETKKMEGNAKIIKLIARDENLHLAFTQHLLKTLPKDDPDFAKIAIQCQDEVLDIFNSVIQQEKDWAKHLFVDGSMIGLNENLLCDYVNWIAAKRMKSVGLAPIKAAMSNPLPWTEKWIAGSEVQVAPQETEISSYLSAAINMSSEPGKFKGFRL